MMKKFHRTLLAVSAGLCLVGGANANIIDLFDDPASPSVQQVEDTTANSTSVSNEYPGGVVPSTSILGGYRDLIVNKVSGSSRGASRLYVADGALNFSNDTGSTPVVGSATVQWDGRDNLVDGTANVGHNDQGLNANLVNQTGCPSTGCVLFQAEVLFADQGFDYNLRIYSGAGNSSTLTALSQFPVNQPGWPVSDTATYLFSWFDLAQTTGTVANLAAAPLDSNGHCTSVGSNGGVYWCLDGLAFLINQTGSGADFTSVSSVEFNINNLRGTAALDLTIGSITKEAPEPGMLALVGLGLFGAGLARRRAKSIKQ